MENENSKQILNNLEIDTKFIFKPKILKYGGTFQRSKSDFHKIHYQVSKKFMCGKIEILESNINLNLNGIKINKLKFFQSDLSKI